MKVLHFQSMGVGSILSERLNRLPGVKSRVLVTCKHPFGFRADYVMLAPIPRIAHWFLGMSRWGFDILHSHDGFPLPDYVLRRWKGRFIQHYHSPLAQDLYPVVKFPKPLILPPPTGATQCGEHQIFRVNHLTIPSFVSTPAHVDNIPGSEWLPVPVDLVKFNPMPKPVKSNKIAIGFSYNPDADPEKLKYIPASELTKFALDHPEVELWPLTTSLKYEHMPAYYRHLDIYVDRIGLDFYGWQASEAAACGVAVVTQMKERPLGCPFLNAGTKENVPGVLNISGMAQSNREAIARDCQNYAAKVHDVKTVTMQCVNRYRRMMDVEV